MNPYELAAHFCIRHAYGVIAVSLIIALAAIVYVAGNFEMDTNAEDLLSAGLPWRQHQLAFDRAFPQRNNLTVAVIDGSTPERTQEAAATLVRALEEHPDVFPVVRDIQDDPFFAKNGFLYLSVDELRDTLEEIIKAQPFLAPLAADPSLRGLMDSISAALDGIQNGATSLDALRQPFEAMSAVTEAAIAGRFAFFSWQSMIAGQKPSLRETRRIIEIQARLDYSSLTPGGEASALLRKLAADAGLTPDRGVSVRLTGPVPLSDEEFATLADRAALMSVLMVAAVLVMLWIAVQSAKILAAILATLLVGLAVTAGIGLLAVGRFNIISVAFIPLVVGIGIDFAIQYSVRYRAERHRIAELREALARAGHEMGPPLTLAAAATAVSFLSFLPTSYSGLAELGFVAGCGMIVTYALSGTLLPALLAVLVPRAEQAEIGLRWLAPIDDLLRRRRRVVMISAGVLALAAVAALPLLAFDANPLHLRSRTTESVATLYDLMADPETSPNTIDVLAPSPADAQTLAERLSTLPEVREARTLMSFIPDRQAEKLSLIADASLIMDTTLNPFEEKAPPSPAEVLASVQKTKEKLRQAASHSAGAPAAATLRLAAALEALEKAGPAALTRLDVAFVPSLKTMLANLRAAFSAQRVTAENLPAVLKREWSAPDGRARVQVYPSGDVNDPANLKRFSAAVLAIAPEATGTPISTEASGRTIVDAFLQAGLYSFLAIVLMLGAFLRQPKHMALALLPLVMTELLILGTCVALGIALNFANIIVLPLSLGIGIAFNIYFLMAWLRGHGQFLRSSLARAVILSALTTASGFGTLWLSRHPGTASLGELLMISLAWTLAVTLFFVPALLYSVTPDSVTPDNSASVTSRSSVDRRAH